MPLVLKRVEACKQDRENSPDYAGRRKLAETPTLFRELNNPASFILVPKVSSERRRYVPMGFLDYNTISSKLFYHTGHFSVSFWCIDIKCSYGVDANSLWQIKERL